MMPEYAPFDTNVLGCTGTPRGRDYLPSCYQGPYGPAIPGNNVQDFLARELSLSRLEGLHRLGYAGSVRPAMPLHEQVRIGREIVITERMDLHLLWTNDGKLFVKPLPGFLFDPEFWRTHFCCQTGCECRPAAREDNNNNSGATVSGQNHIDSSHSPGRNTPTTNECTSKKLWKCAMGFLYSYVCLIPYESDFTIASEKHLLPQQLSGSSQGWESWKNFASEILSNDIRTRSHPRFRRGELRLARLNTLHRLAKRSIFEPYLRHRWNYGRLFRDNITLIATASVFIVLVLTAMQLGLATDQLGQNKRFMAVSHGFAVFAILGPLCAFGVVVLEAFCYLVKDLPMLLSAYRKRGATVTLDNNVIPV